jgi:1,4-dihydroxy-2-naphthoate octaprenyltransferase
LPLVITKRHAWLAAFRLHTLPLATCSILMGSAVAYTEHKFSFIILLLALSTAICLQILSNISNDYGDAKHGADNDDRVGPKRMVQQKIISMEEMKMGIMVFIILSLVSGIMLLVLSVQNVGIYMAFVLLLLGLGAIGAAIAYTATDNPYGYTGWGDLSVLIFFGIIGVFGSISCRPGHLKLMYCYPLQAWAC